MSAEQSLSPKSVVREIKRRTRRKFSPQEKIRIVLEGLKCEESIAELCRREGMSPKPLLSLEQELSRGGQEAAERIKI